jgi:choline-sulfatase
MNGPIHRLLRWVLPIIGAGLIGYSIGRTPQINETPVGKLSPTDKPIEPLPKEVASIDESKAVQPNIILITVDTLRADHLPFYGSTRMTAPWASNLAENGVVFSHAYSTSAWTVPSVASLITGVLPATHNLQTGAIVNQNVLRQKVLSDEFGTIAERLKEAGYTTIGVVTNKHLRESLGFAQGFDYFTNGDFNSAGWVNQTVADLQSEINEAERYFLWLHFFDPHDTYTARRPWVEHFNDEAIAWTPELSLETTTERNKRFRLWSTMKMKKMRASPQTVNDPVVLETLKTLYDSEIRFMDDWIGMTMSQVDPNNEALIVFTADHGDEFRDHGGLGHRRTLFNELTRIPLVVRLPSQQSTGGNIDTPASLIDILPTLCDYALCPDESYLQLPGTSLRSEIEGTGKITNRPLFMSTTKEAEFSYSGVIDWPFKLIVNNIDGHRSLYNLVNDPGEHEDLSVENKAIVERLAATIVASEQGAAPKEVQTLRQYTDTETIKQLESMGYIDR